MSGLLAVVPQGDRPPMSADLRDFIAALYPFDDDLLLEFRALPSKTQVFVPRNNSGRLRTFLRRKENLYFGVATRNDESSGTAENCRELTALFVDLDFKDTNEHEVRDRLAAFPLPPSVLVQSGGGLHGYWCLREAFDVSTEDTRQAAKSLLRRLAQALDGDLAAAEVARVLRLPGSLNFKYDPPRPVTIELLDASLRYNPSDFDEFVPSERTEKRTTSTATNGTIPAGGRNAHLTSLAGSMRRRGMTPAAIEAALVTYNGSQCDPPLDNAEVKAIAASVGKYAPAETTGPTFKRSDAGNAELFAATYQDLVRYDHAAQFWRVWTGHHFAADRDGEVRRKAKVAVRSRLETAAKLTNDDERKLEARWAIQSESRRGLDAMLAIAQSERPLAVTGDDWDRNPMLFPVANGVIDLASGRLRSGRPEDGITRVAPVTYDEAARCDRWERFMREIFAKHPEIAAYIQRVIGYALTGLTVEQVLWILFGSGGNGKSMLVETLMARVFGADLAWTMPFPSAGWSDAMSEYQKASLSGRRLVQSSEVARQGRLNEELIKSLTGTDTVNARHPYGRPFQFVPQAKFLLRVNDKPQIADESHGMWRRIKLVPFLETFPVDGTLGGVLASEASGILNWAIRGCLDWQREGLCEPPVVQAATAEYRDEQDQLSEFTAARCVTMEGVSVRASVLYAAYKAWALDSVKVEDRLSLTAFGKRMKARVRFNDTGRHTIYFGIAVAAEDERDVA